MKILTVDTSTSTCSVALTIGEQVAAEFLLDGERTLSETLLNAIDRVLGDAGIELRDLDGFGVALGPGAFTGVRVGVSTVKGLALATGKPATGFSSLAMLALNLPLTSLPVCTLFDARKREVYGAIYRCTPLPRAIHGDCVTAPERFMEKIQGPTIFVGDGALRYRGIIEETLGELAIFAPPHCHHPRASAGALLALDSFRSGSATPLSLLNPTYIRPSEAELARMKKETL